MPVESGPKIVQEEEVNTNRLPPGKTTFHFFFNFVNKQANFSQTKEIVPKP